MKIYDEIGERNMDYKLKDLSGRTPDNIITLDIASVKTLQIGYHAENILLYYSENDEFTLKEYIGYTAYEYLGKVTANRFKTTIRYGRREEVNHDTYVEIFLPKSWHGELLLYTQYGYITCQETMDLERFAAETSEGTITLKEIRAPRIRLASSSNSVTLEKGKGFVDVHTTSGSIDVISVEGGARLETTTGQITANFESLNNVVECNSLSGNMELTFADACNISVDGITKTGQIQSDIENVTIRMKPGNVKNVVGTKGEKPFQNVRLTSINGNIILK